MTHYTELLVLDGDGGILVEATLARLREEFREDLVSPMPERRFLIFVALSALPDAAGFGEIEPETMEFVFEAFRAFRREDAGWEGWADGMMMDAVFDHFPPHLAIRAFDFLVDVRKDATLFDQATAALRWNWSGLDRAVRWHVARRVERREFPPRLLIGSWASQMRELCSVDGVWKERARKFGRARG